MFSHLSMVDRSGAEILESPVQIPPRAYTYCGCVYTYIYVFRVVLCRQNLAMGNHGKNYRMSDRLTGIKTYTSGDQSSLHEGQFKKLKLRPDRRPDHNNNRVLNKHTYLFFPLTKYDNFFRVPSPEFRLN